MAHLIFCHDVFIRVLMIIMSLYSVKLKTKLSTMSPYFYCIFRLYKCVSFISEKSQEDFNFESKMAHLSK